MKSTSHFAMAHLIYTELQKNRICLNRTAFAYGNIAPDYVPTMIVTPHFGKVCVRRIEELSLELSSLPLDGSGRVGAEYSRQLGMLCHYVCDYFCFAHNKDFSGGVKQHMAFEAELDQFLRGNWKGLLELGGFERLSGCRNVHRLLAVLEEEKHAYLAEGYTFENDLSYAFRVCVGLIAALVSMSRVVFAENGVRVDRLALSFKGFATGKGYVFRMFYYKNRNNNIFFMPELMSPILLS